MKDLKVVFYEKASGKIPVDDFLKSLNADTYQKVMREIEELKTNESYLSAPHSKSFGRNLFELRIRHKDVAVRLLYSYSQENEIVITNGFLKKGRCTPEDEKKLSRKYYSELQERRKKQKSR